MMPHTLLLPALLLLPLALAACEAPPAADEADACGAAGFQSLVGQNESVVFATTLTQTYRIIGPDDVVTMDFNPERVNFRTDAAGTITSVDCG
jgi:hypothetical protein